MKRKPKKTPNEIVLETQRARIRDLIAKAGGQQRVADQLGISQAAVSKWIVNGFLPLRRAVEVEAHYGVPRTSIANPQIVQMLKPVEFDAA